MTDGRAGRILIFDGPRPRWEPCLAGREQLNILFRTMLRLPARRLRNIHHSSAAWLGTCVICQMNKMMLEILLKSQSTPLACATPAPPITLTCTNRQVCRVFHQWGRFRVRLYQPKKVQTINDGSTTSTAKLPIHCRKEASFTWRINSLCFTPIISVER